MGSEWRKVNLGDVTENFDGSRIPVKEVDRRSGPYPYYGASGIVDHVDKYIFDGEYLLIAEDGENLRTRNTPIAFLANGKFWVNNHAHIVRGNSTADTRFLMYILATSDISGYLTGSTMPKLTQGNMNRIPLLVPALPEQRAIAAVLGALDDKIELNRRMNRTLETMARALFKSWFVDFDPVRAKMERRPTGLPEEIEALFVGEMEAGRPLGWGVGSVGDIAENIRRSVQPGDIDPSTPYIALEHMPRQSISLADWGIADDLASNKYEFKQGEILFGKLRPYFHKVGVAPIDGVCSTDILVVRPKRSEWFGFLLGHISSRELIDYTTALSTGTKMPRTNWHDIARYEVVLPPADLAAKFSALADEFVRRIRVNIEESRTLTALRDALLPKLMSGEVRVSHAENLFEVI